MGCSAVRPPACSALNAPLCTALWQALSRVGGVLCSGLMQLPDKGLVGRADEAHELTRVAEGEEGSHVGAPLQRRRAGCAEDLKALAQVARHRLDQLGVVARERIAIPVAAGTRALGVKHLESAGGEQATGDESSATVRALKGVRPAA